MSTNKEILLFLTKLAKNNNRVWFEKHKPEFKELKDSFKEKVYDIAHEIGKFDKGVYSEPDFIKLFRIYRDIRFSKNKTPYKENFGATIVHGGKRSNNPVYYIHLQPGQSFIGGGWLPEDPKLLYAVRKYISENFKRFDKIMNKKGIKDNFELGDYMGVLKTAPKGFSKDDPSLKYINHKSFTMGVDLSDKEVGGNDFNKLVVKQYKNLYPFLEFFYDAMEEINKKPGKYILR